MRSETTSAAPGAGGAASGVRPDFDVLVAGAGPVGMLLALLLGRDGYRVLVAEAREQRGDGSRAIGVTSPTLAALERLGLLKQCLDAGVAIREARIFGDGGRLLGQLSFPQRAGRPPEVISLPQTKLEAILEQALHSLDEVVIRKGRRVTQSIEEDGVVRAGLLPAGGGGAETVAARWLVACDGAGSETRGRGGFAFRSKTYPARFTMADFEDRSGLGDEVRLFFTAGGALESFPLPDGRRRWVVQCDPGVELADEPELLAAMARRSGWAPEPGDRRSPWSTFVPRRLLCRKFHRGRLVLCGDAAHVMSPIGGQGMNVGIGDALAAHRCLRQLLQNESVEGGNDPIAIGRAEREASLLCRAYDTPRRAAFIRASRLAALGMWVGTRRGGFVSGLRARLLRPVLASPAFARRLTAHFAMSEEAEAAAASVGEPIRGWRLGQRDGASKVDPGGTRATC